MVKGQNILVAGGSGLIGTHLSRRLREEGAWVRATFLSRKPSFSTKNDMRCDFTQWEDCLEATKEIQSVFICATPSLSAPVMRENPTGWILPHLKIGAGLLEACCRNGVEKVVFISSSTVYPEALEPLCEEALDWNRAPCSLDQGIGEFHRYMEQLCHFYHRVYGIQIGIVRPSSVYGPYDRFDEGQGRVLPALIQRALKKENPFVVWGDGNEVRDFLFVDDLVDDLLDVLERHCICDPLNIGSGVGTTIREAVKMILNVCGHSVEPYYDVLKPQGIPYRVLDIAKFQSLLGRRMRTPLEKGIQKTVEWFQSQ